MNQLHCANLNHKICLYILIIKMLIGNLDVLLYFIILPQRFTIVRSKESQTTTGAAVNDHGLCSIFFPVQAIFCIQLNTWSKYMVVPCMYHDTIFQCKRLRKAKVCMSALCAPRAFSTIINTNKIYVVFTGVSKTRWKCN